MIIYLDMDGVLCDFATHYKLLSKEENDEFKLDSDLFQKFVDNSFFTQLNKLDIGSRLVEYLTGLELVKSGYIRIGILSSTASLERGVTFGNKVTKQKLNWLSNNYTYNFEPTIFVSNKEKKQMFATPDSVLLDDCLSNVEQFAQNGGTGILVNSLSDFNDIKDKLETSILSIKDKQNLF